MTDHLFTTETIFFDDSTAWEKSSVENIVQNALKGAEDGELFLEFTQSESFSWDDGRLRNASYDTDRGFGLRSVAGDEFAYAHSSDMSEAALKRAADTVSALSAGYNGVMDVAPRQTNEQLYIDSNPLPIVAFDKKVKLMQDIDAYARTKDPQVKQVSVSLSGEWQAVRIIRADGEECADIRPLVRLNVGIYLEDKNGRMEDGFHGLGGRYTYEHLFKEETWKAAVDESLRQARVNMEAKDSPAGEMPVVLGNGWPGIMLHEAIGHGLEGDFNRKKTSAFSEMIGKQVATKGVTVVDDGTVPHARGSLTVDDEGTPTQRTPLIEDGILTGYMQDRMNARLMKASPTGNGRRESYAAPPYPRMTNTLMTGGDCTSEDIIASVKRGVYAVNFSEGQVDITSGKFTFSASEAYLIEDGKVTSPLRGATLIGNGPDVLTRVSMIGNDTEIDCGVGSCGKNGQWVPVGVGQPTLKIDKLTVGGTSTENDV